MSEEQTTFTEAAEVSTEPVKKKGGRKKTASEGAAKKPTEKELIAQILNSNEETKATNQQVRADLLATNSKIDDLCSIADALAQKMDEMQNSQVEPDAPAAAPDVSGVQEYVTSREVFNTYIKQITARDTELADKNFKNLMEKMCYIRDDYSKLCKDMHKNVGSFSAMDVLSSFEAFLVDLENMLDGAGVKIGHFGNDGDQVDVNHQRIIGVVSTNDPKKNGVVAERLSEGYEYNGRAILKEKVNVYKLTEETPKKPETGFREILG